MGFWGILYYSYNKETTNIAQVIVNSDKCRQGLKTRLETRRRDVEGFRRSHSDNPGEACGSMSDE